MTDLISVMSTLVDQKGRILIDGIYDDVVPLLPEEEEIYKKITFDTVCCSQRQMIELLLSYSSLGCLLC